MPLGEGAQWSDFVMTFRQRFFDVISVHFRAQVDIVVTVAVSSPLLFAYFI